MTTSRKCYILMQNIIKYVEAIVFVMCNFVLECILVFICLVVHRSMRIALNTMGTRGTQK